MPIFTIARFTLLEALRTRFFWLALAVAACLIAFAAFVQHVAVTESARIQTAVLAASLRTACVFLLSLFAISSVVREFQDKGLELILSLEIPRASYVLGKLLGFAAAGAVLAAFAFIPVAWYAQAAPAAVWAASLMCELWMMAALAVFCVVSFSQVMPAASFAAAFYLLARSISAIQLISHSALLDSGSGAHRAIGAVVDAIAFIIPALDNFTQSSWLVGGGAGLAALVPIALQTAIYLALLVSAAMFDLYRRNF